MNRFQTTCILGFLSTGLVISTWLFWAKFDQPPTENWQGFDALGVLISGLAFVGLIITVAIQLGAMRDNERTTNEALNIHRQAATVQALNSARIFAGSRIEHLKNHIKDGSIKETDDISPELAEEEIRQLRQTIKTVETKLKSLLEELTQ